MQMEVSAITGINRHVLQGLCGTVCMVQEFAHTHTQSRVLNVRIYRYIQVSKGYLSAMSVPVPFRCTNP